ncbi:hypothetical protein BC832DRAFT_542999 [Gaertneriomyces semiglobifer]|nr:hypothetical protein BC832DRAFT_542999 [Gaertneriomyces semiglobifer]
MHNPQHTFINDRGELDIIYPVQPQEGVQLQAEMPLLIQQEEDTQLLALRHNAPLGLDSLGRLSLSADDTLGLDDSGNLTVVPTTFETPLDHDPSTKSVALRYTKPLVLKDDALTVDSKEIAKGAGAIRVYSALDDIAPGVGDWIDIDLPGNLEEYLENSMLVKLNVTDDFQQTGSRLAIRSKGMHEIPYYSGLSGFNSSNRFTYNETLQTLTAPTFCAEAVDYSVTEPRQLVTAGYVHQLYQSQTGSAIDIGEITNGRKLVSVNHDETLAIDETNRLGVRVDTIADGTLVKAVNGKLTVDPYTAGDGISIVDNVVSSTLTYGGSLFRSGDVVSGREVLSGSSNVTVTTSNPFAYTISVTNPQSQLDDLEDKVTDLNEKTDQNKTETDTKITDLEAEDDRLENKIDAVESRVSQQETKSDLLSNDVNTNKSNITQLNTAKNQIQGDLLSLGAEVTGLTGVVDTVNTVATGVQVAQALMKGDVTSLQGVVTGIAGEVTGLSSTVAAIQAMPVVRGVVGIGLLAAQDPITGIVTITNTSAPVMLRSRGVAPVDPIPKDNEAGEIGPPSDPPIPPPEPPPGPPPPDGLKSGGGGGITDGPCVDPIPPIFGGRSNKGERTWYRDSFGKRWSNLPTVEVDGIRRTVLEYDENNYPIVEAGHVDIILRRNDDDQISAALLTHDRHLQPGYDGVYNEHMQQVPNLAMLFETWRDYMLPYVQSCNYIHVGQGLLKDGNTLSLSEDLSTYAKTSSIKALGFKDTLSYAELTGRPTLGSLAAKSSVSWTSEVANKPTLGTLSTKNTVDWNGSDITNKPTDLTTKTYVDSLSYLTVGTGLVKAGNTVSLGSDLGTFEVKTNLKALAYKDAVSWTEISSKPTLGTLAAKSTVSWTSEVTNKPTLGTLSTKNNIDYNSTDIINKPDLSIYETKTALKGLAYKDKVDYTTDLLNVPTSIVTERISVGTTSEVVAFPPTNLTAGSTILSGKLYGNGTYVASSSSKFNNSTQYDAWHAFTDNTALYPWYPLSGTYKATAPFDYVGSMSTTIDGVEVLGEWIQLQLPLPILLQSFDIAVLSVTTEFYIKEFVLVGSNDGTTFTQLMTSTLPWGPAGAQTLNIPVPHVSKAFKTYRLIIKSLHGNRTYCQVARLTFNGIPVAMDIKGVLSTDRVIAGGLDVRETLKFPLGTLSHWDNRDLIFPPATFQSTHTSTFVDLPYGNGTYEASASSSFYVNWGPGGGFGYAQAQNAMWRTASAAYSATTGEYLLNTTTSTNQGDRKGEWLQLQLPEPILFTVPASNVQPCSYLRLVFMSKTPGQTYGDVIVRMVKFTGDLISKNGISLDTSLNVVDTVHCGKAHVSNEFRVQNRQLVPMGGYTARWTWVAESTGYEGTVPFWPGETGASKITDPLPTFFGTVTQQYPATFDPFRWIRWTNATTSTS